MIALFGINELNTEKFEAGSRFSVTRWCQVTNLKSTFHNIKRFKHDGTC